MKAAVAILENGTISPRPKRFFAKRKERDRHAGWPPPPMKTSMIIGHRIEECVREECAVGNNCIDLRPCDASHEKRVQDASQNPAPSPQRTLIQYLTCG